MYGQLQATSNIKVRRMLHKIFLFPPHVLMWRLSDPQIWTRITGLLLQALQGKRDQPQLNVT